MIPDGQRSWLNGSQFWLFSGVSFYLLWALVNLPGLTTPWWYSDDFWMMEQPLQRLTWDFASQAGRPVTAFLFLLNVFNRSPDAELGNLAVRWFQGMLHAGNGLILLAILSRFIHRGMAYVCVLPFLLWAFNGESVLWFQGIQHVAGAGFALGGCLLVYDGVTRRQVWLQWAGVVCTALAVLTNQAPAFVGLYIWLVMLAWRFGPEHFVFYPADAVTPGQKLDALLAHPVLPKVTREGFQLFAGLSVGSVISVVMTFGAGYERSTVGGSFGEKLSYLIELNVKLFFWPEFYPLSLKILSLILILSFVLVLAWCWLRRRLNGGRLGLWLLTVSSGMALLFLANLAMAGRWPSFRIFYSAPVMFSVLLASLCLILGRRAYSFVVVWAMVASAHFAWLANENAAQFPALYQADLKVVAAADAYAKEHGIPYALALPHPWCGDLQNWNIHSISFNHLDAHRSEFITSWSPHPFIRLHAKHLTTWPDTPERIAAGNDQALQSLEEARVSYQDFIQSQPAGPPHLQFFRAPERADLILIAPR